MKKFKGYINTEGDFVYFKVILKKHGASHITALEEDKEYYQVYGKFKASFGAARRLLLDEKLVGMIDIKNFPLLKLVKLSHFNNLKVIHKSEFDPMLHYYTDLRIGWMIDIDITTYIALYSKNKKDWEEALKKAGFASAEYVCIENNKIYLFGYNTVHELFPYMIKRNFINFQPTYYIDKTEILHTYPSSFLKDLIDMHPVSATNAIDNNIYTQLLEEYIKEDMVNLPEQMEHFNQSESNVAESKGDPFKWTFSHPNKNKLTNMCFKKNISHLLFTMNFIEITYEDKSAEQFYFGSKRLRPDVTREQGNKAILVEHFIAMDILNKISMYFVLTF